MYILLFLVFFLALRLKIDTFLCDTSIFMSVKVNSFACHLFDKTFKCNCTFPEGVTLQHIVNIVATHAYNVQPSNKGILESWNDSHMFRVQVVFFSHESESIRHIIATVIFLYVGKWFDLLQHSVTWCFWNF